MAFYLIVSYYNFKQQVSIQGTAVDSLHSCDLGRVAIYAFVEAARPELLLTAPQTFVEEAQKDCVDHAAKVLDLCQLILKHCPNFVCRDPYVSVCLYQAARVTLWDLFRHPSPSMMMRRLFLEQIRPVIIMLHSMQRLFQYTGSIVSLVIPIVQNCVSNNFVLLLQLLDFLTLLRRYGLTSLMVSM